MPLRLYKWSTTAIMDKGASDPAQIPASSLTIDAYKQGATVSAAVASVTGGGVTTVVSVFDTGQLLVNSTVQAGTDSTKNLTITAINSPTNITVRNDGSTFALAKYDRLVMTSTRPTLYRDLIGTDILSSAGQAVTDSRGFVEFYIAQRLFDYIITNGSTKSLYKDERVGAIEIGSAMANIQDFPTVQAAVDYVKKLGVGGTVYVPGGDYSPSTTPSYNGVVMPNWVNLKGGAKGESRLILTDTSVSNVSLDPTASGNVGAIILENIDFLGANSAGTGKGLNAYVPGKACSGVHVRHCSFLNTPSWGIDFFVDSPHYVDQALFEDVACNFAKSGGSLRIGQDNTAGGNVMTFIKCQFNGPSFGTYGVDSLKVGCIHIAHSTNINFNGCAIQPLDCSPGVSVGSVSRNLGFYNCHFETNTSGGTRNGHWFTLDAPSAVTGLTIIGCDFRRQNTAMGVAFLEVGNDCALVQTLVANCFFFSDKITTPATDDIQFGTNTGHKDFVMINTHLDYPINGTGNRLPIANGFNKMILIDDGRIKFQGLTTAERNALLYPRLGEVIYNTDTNVLNLYNGSWVAGL